MLEGLLPAGLRAEPIEFARLFFENSSLGGKALLVVVALLATMLAVGTLALCGYGLWIALRWIAPRARRAPRSIGVRVTTSVRRLTEWLLNPDSSYTSRLLTVALVAGGVLVGLALLAVAVAGIEASGASSAPVLEFVVGLATNIWVWVIAVIVLFRNIFLFSDRLKAREAARTTGYSYQTIRRLAEEVRKPDMRVAERLIVQTGDTKDDIVGYIQNALAGDGHTLGLAEEDSDTDFEFVGDTNDETAASNEDADDDRDEPPEAALPLWARFRIMGKDIAAALDFESVLWRFGAPAGAVFFFELLLVRFWVSWWVYPILLAVAITAGTAYYWQTDFRHRRRLETLREDDEDSPWSDLSILVKTVETPENEFYIGFMAGKTYAGTDREEFAEVLAERALDRLEGRNPAPSILERQAWLLRRYIPNFVGWREEREKPTIVDELIDAVADADEGILPKRVLFEQVVEGDRRYIAGGLLFVGLGRDPALVAEVYEDLVEAHALVEEDITIEHTDGSEQEITAVSLGDEPMPRNMAQLRAEFSSRFRKNRVESRYDPPECGAAGDPKPFVLPEG